MSLYNTHSYLTGKNTRINERYVLLKKCCNCAIFMLTKKSLTHYGLDGPGFEPSSTTALVPPLKWVPRPFPGVKRQPPTFK
jgi:hypothetical protein